MSLRFLTAGELHGPALVAILDGLPAGLPLDVRTDQPSNWIAARRGSVQGRA